VGSLLHFTTKGKYSARPVVWKYSARESASPYFTGRWCLSDQTATAPSTTPAIPGVHGAETAAEAATAPAAEGAEEEVDDVETRVPPPPSRR